MSCFGHVLPFFAICLSFFVIVCHFVAIFVSFVCHLLSFSHPARVAGSGAELESPKTQFHQHAGHGFLSFSCRFLRQAVKVANPV